MHCTCVCRLSVYVQESGRGGCDGRVAVALLNYPTGDNHLSPDMRKYIKKYNTL